MKLAIAFDDAALDVITTAASIPETDYCAARDELGIHLLRRASAKRLFNFAKNKCGLATTFLGLPIQQAVPAATTTAAASTNPEAVADTVDGMLNFNPP